MEVAEKKLGVFYLVISLGSKRKHVFTAKLLKSRRKTKYLNLRPNYCSKGKQLKTSKSTANTLKDN